MSWQLTNGEIPDGLCVCHSCDNPPCVNPKHLWVGTNADNVADKIAKGRLYSGKGAGKGMKHHWSNLTDEDVISIRKLYATGKYPYTKLSKMFNTDMSNIGYIIRRETWTHI